MKRQLFCVQENYFIFLFCALLTLQAFNGNAQNNEKTDKGRFFIRGGVGIQGGVSIFFPTELNEYTKDFWDDLVSDFYEWGYDGNNPVIPIIVGFNYDLKLVLRVVNNIQFEVWREKFYAVGLQFESHFYSYGWGYDDEELEATYQFQPNYSATGANLLFTPGARKKPVFFTIGAGIGKYDGTFKYHEDGSHIVNDDTYTFDNTKVYQGDVVGYNGVLGLTYVPWKYLELETFITGRMANIPELTYQGEVFRNYFRDGKRISLDFSGFDLRLGIKVIIP